MTAKRISLMVLPFIFALIAFSMFLFTAQSLGLAAIQTQPEIISETSTPTSVNSTYWFTQTSTNYYSIWDNSCISAPPEDSIGVPENAHVYTVRVGVNISHTNRGDLQIYLREPGGLEVLTPQYDPQDRKTKKFEKPNEEPSLGDPHSE